MRRISIHPSVVLVILAACLLAGSIGGSDIGRYRAWVVALRGGDIFLIQSSVGSPLGLPLTHWSPGPGMLFVVPWLVLGNVVDANLAPLVAGWLSTLLFWWAYFRILAWASRGTFALTALGAGAAFLGTHAGFLSRSHASESLAIAFVALLVASAVDPDEGLVASSWTVGCSTALLVAIRSHYAVYALPALLLAAGRIFDVGFARSGIGRDSNEGARHRLVAALLLLAPLLIAVFQQGIVNRWMTGSVASSPYVFGDSVFRSINWLDPLFFPVVAHPWHGLLVYHPLYALGFVAAVICLIRSTSRRERILWAGAIVAVAINLWIQAAWHVWWLGTRTYGVRGMAPAAVVLVPAVVRVIADARSTDGIAQVAKRRVWVVATALSCLWSFLMLLQGPSQFYTWSAVFAGQRAAIAGLLDVERAAWVLAVAMLAGVWLWARSHDRLVGADLLVVLSASLLWLLSLEYGLASALRGWRSGNSKLFLPAALILILTGSIFVLTRLAAGLIDRYRRQGQDRVSASDELARSLARLSITLAFLMGTVLFGRLALNTENRLAEGDIPDRNYAYVASFDVQSALTGFREYHRIDGFERRKEALRRFLSSYRADLGR